MVNHDAKDWKIWNIVKHDDYEDEDKQYNET